MKKNTIRRLYLIGLILAVLLFAAMVWDHYENANDLLAPLTIAFSTLVILLIIMLFLRPSDASPTQVFAGEAAPTGPNNIDYLGDVHEVVDLEGIGPTYAEKLHAMEVYNTQQLLFADSTKLARATGAPAKTVANWKSMSQLVKIPGIGPQYAEALVRAGIDGIEELRDEPAAAIAGAVTGYLESLENNVIGNTITAKRVDTWQKKARKLKRDVVDADAVKVMPLESKQAKADSS